MPCLNFVPELMSAEKQARGQNTKSTRRKIIDNNNYYCPRSSKRLLPYCHVKLGIQIADSCLPSLALAGSTLDSVRTHVKLDTCHERAPFSKAHLEKPMDTQVGRKSNSRYD